MAWTILELKHETDQSPPTGAEVNNEQCLTSLIFPITSEFQNKSKALRTCLGSGQCSWNSWTVRGWTLVQARNYLLSTPIQISQGPNKPPVQSITGLFPRDKAAGAWHWPPTLNPALRLNMGRLCQHGIIQGNLGL